ncbi:MAG: hypothetical protein ACYC2H_00050 [Thermoplasmatota archaeon]
MPTARLVAGERSLVREAVMREAVPVFERIHIKIHGGGEWDYRSPILAEGKAAQRLREACQRAHGAILNVTITAWYSTGAQPSREADWQHVEVAVEVPARKAPELRDLIAAGLLQHAATTNRPVEQRQAAWRQAEHLQGRTYHVESARWFVMRCLKPTTHRFSDPFSATTLNLMPSPPEPLAADDEDDALTEPHQILGRSPANRLPVLAVRIHGLAKPWYRRHSPTLDLEPAEEAVAHIVASVPFGITRRLPLEVTLPEERLFCFTLRVNGGSTLPDLHTLASQHLRHQAKKPGVLPGHKVVLRHLASCFAGHADLDDVTQAKVPSQDPSRVFCDCGRQVPLRCAFVAGIEVNVLASHAPLGGRPGWTGLCKTIEDTYSTLDPAVPWTSPQGAPSRSSYCLDRTDWWMGIRLTVPQDLGPVGPPRRP